jgi:hypothetical protein
LRLAISKARSNSLTALFLFKYATTDSAEKPVNLICHRR